MLGAALVVAVPPAERLEWHAGEGKIFTGRLVDVVGPLLLIARSNAASFAALDSLSDTELERVGDFMAHAASEAPGVGKFRGAIAAAVNGRLSILKEGKLVRYDLKSRAEPRFYLLYFSAGWCGPCHRFTPELVKAYEEIKKIAGDQIELLFISDDNSRIEQVAYVAEYKMPWPVLDYNSRGGVPIAERWAGAGIPCLVLVTRDGELVFHSYRGEEYLGPRDVLEKLNRLLPFMNEDVQKPHDYYHRLALIHYLKSHPNEDAPVQPYYVALDGRKFAGLTLGDVFVQVNVDAGGLVTQIDYDENVPSAIRSILEDDIGKWKFLPKLVKGQPVKARARLPISFRGVTRS